MVKQVHILFAYFGEVIYTLYLHRLGLNPLAVLDIRALGAYLTDIYLGVEVCGKGISVVACIAVKDINVVYFVKIVLLSICAENACNAGVKSAAQQSGDACLFKSLTVCPLP